MTHSEGEIGEMNNTHCFELWLDESGNFIADTKNRSLNPSLVGGILIERGLIDEHTAKNIIGRDYVHFNQEKSGSYSLEVLGSCAELNADFVIFQNEERIFVIDSDTTYLNIISEGIIQLLLLLSAKYGDFDLDILVATRKNTVKGSGILKAEEYEFRLREKIVLGLARNVLSRKNEWKYKVSFDDARVSKRLMLADGVCNTYLTKTSSKFTDQQRNEINCLYKQEYIFSVFASMTDVKIKRTISEGKLGDALFELYFNDDLAGIRLKYIALVVDRMKRFSQVDLRNQFSGISFKIDSLVRVQRDYRRLKTILSQLQNELIPMLKERQIHVPEFTLDIVLYLYTIYTHEGNLEASKQNEVFAIELEQVTDLFEKFKYYILYKTRQAVNQMNIFDIEGSIGNMTKVINLLEQMRELLPIIDGAEKEMFGHKNIMLAKAYGTRLQAWSMRIPEDKDYIEKARADYEHALQHFNNDNDKERQHLYLCQAECECSNIEAAFLLMLKAENLDHLGIRGAEEFLRKLALQGKNKAIYKYLAYYRIMSYAKRCGNKELADYMYKLLLNNGVVIESFKSEYKGVHPLELIYWYAGDYFADSDIKKACKYYDLAIEMCCRGSEEVTLRVIQLGVLTCKALTYLNQNKQREAQAVVEKLGREHEKLLSANLPESIFNYIKVLTAINIDDVDKRVLETFEAHARAIN